MLQTLLLSLTFMQEGMCEAEYAAPPMLPPPMSAPMQRQDYQNSMFNRMNQHDNSDRFYNNNYNNHYNDGYNNSYYEDYGRFQNSNRTFVERRSSNPTTIPQYSLAPKPDKFSAKKQLVVAKPSPILSVIEDEECDCSTCKEAMANEAKTKLKSVVAKVVTNEKECDCSTCMEEKNKKVSVIVPPPPVDSSECGCGKECGCSTPVKTVSTKSFSAAEAKKISAMRKVFKQLKEAVETAEEDAVDIKVADSNMDYVTSELKDAGYSVMKGNPGELHVSW